MDHQIVAAGADQPYDVPVRLDRDLVARQDRHAGQLRTAVSLIGQCDADPDQRCPHAAAAEFPAAVDLQAAWDTRGDLWRERAAGEDRVRAIGVDFPQRVDRERGQIGGADTEARDPSGRSVGGGDRFDHPQECRRRQLVAAEPLGCHSAIDADRFQLLDHARRDMTQPLDLVAAGADIGQELLEAQAFPSRCVGLPLCVLRSFSAYLPPDWHLSLGEAAREMPREAAEKFVFTFPCHQLQPDRTRPGRPQRNR